MAYGAVISLKHTIEHLSSSSDPGIVHRYRVITECAKQVGSLEEVLEKLDYSKKSSSRKKVNALDDQIRETASKLEDVLESYLSDRILSQSREHENGTRFFIDMQYLTENIQSFTTRAKKMKQEYIYELDNPLPEEEDDDAAASSRDNHGGGAQLKVVGLSNELTKIKRLLESQHESQIRAISILGMAGIGKTTLANEIFHDPYVSEHFSHRRLWVTVGTKRQLEEIQRDIISQVNPDIKIEERHKQVERYQQKLDYCFLRILRCKGYLIVLDDVWDSYIWVHLKRLLLYIENGSAFLLTTRLREVCEDPDFGCVHVISMRLLNEGESWDLLREKVFGEQSCPPQLEKAGTKIAKKCAGLPLTIVAVADRLSKAEKTPEYWDEVAEKESSVFTDAYDEISKVLYPSYKYLPQHLKACFLYLGVFPENYAIPRYKLVSMWFVERLLEPCSTQTVEECALKYLEELLRNSVVMIYQYSSLESLSTRVKTCGLHSSFWQFCKREAVKNMFFHVLNTPEDCDKDGMKSQRRLCIRNNSLFGIRDVHDSVEDECARTARSLLFYGPYHQYQLPICFGLRLLRVLDAINIRFYEFPIQVLKLVLLRYFTLTFNGNLPASISNLRKLQYLIIHRHLRIKSFKTSSYLPAEIWDMKELKHLQVVGSDLPYPSCDTLLLPNLQTLLGVTTRSCIKDILERIPNLQKLGIQIDLAPDAYEPLRWFNHISHFRELKSIKCVVVNPESKVIAPPPPVSVFPWGLMKLTLSGLGYPWEAMETIDSLRNLEVLKLQCYAFRGPKWVIKERRFLKLDSLIIEDTDLVQWELQYESVPSLVNLSLKHCYKLKAIRWEHNKFMIPKIRIVDCNPLAVACIKKIKEAASGKVYSTPDLNVHCSWSDGDLNS